LYGNPAWVGARPGANSARARPLRGCFRRGRGQRLAMGGAVNCAVCTTLYGSWWFHIEIEIYTGYIGSWVKPIVPPTASGAGLAEHIAQGARHRHEVAALAGA
jgi:hypothetical protein